MVGKKNHKSNKIRGDILEVRLLDSSFTPFYKGKAHINSNREMIELMNELKEKGVTFSTSWF